MNDPQFEQGNIQSQKANMMNSLTSRPIKIMSPIYFDNSFKSLLILTMAFCFSLARAAEPDQGPTFSNEVVRVLQEKCQRCHQPGGIGPMPLETYEQARAWAPRIKENVRRRIMPPWHLDPTIGIQEYKNDFSLSEEQIQILVAWADNDAPEGDPADLPLPA